MDVHAKLAEIRAALVGARAMPMSASCMVNRAELVRAIDELAAMLPAVFGESERDSVLADAHARARDIVAAAEAEGADRVSDAEVYRLARLEAEELRASARTDTAALRQETDDYVDERLATFELTLSRILEAVQRGRERLRGRSELGLDATPGDEIVLPDPGA